MAPAGGDVAAVAVVGGAAQAHVRPHQQLRAGLLDGGDGLRREPLRVQGSARLRVLVPGAANSSTAGTPAAATALRFLHRLVDRELADAGHALHGVAHGASRHHEQRVDERVGREARLAHHATPGVRLARAARSVCWGIAMS